MSLVILGLMPGTSLPTQAGVRGSLYAGDDRGDASQRRVFQ